MKKIYLLLISAIAFIGCSSDDTNTTAVDENAPVTLKMADPNATAETKALYSNLWKIQYTGTMFGHHDDLLYGRTWTQQQGRSDVKDVAGDYPAVYSIDFAEIMDDRSATSTLNADRERTIKEAYARGEVIMAACHLNNPLTGGDAFDNSNTTVVQQILTEGSATNMKFKTWLDKLATFVNNLKDASGKQIPIIFRPFHEHTQTWSWWGKSAATEGQFIALWKFTVDYLKGQKNVHSFIYAISPQIDALGTQESFLFRWPGDDYVDFIGMDSYHGTNTPAFSSNLRNLGLLSKLKLKPCGVTETGIEGLLRNGVAYDTYWTNEISTPLTGKFVSMVVMWRNEYDPNNNGHHFYAPFAGQSSSSNFVQMYNTPQTLFSGDLPNMYQMAEGVTIE
jgi:mannan endo-1,4-beta-mannosidase